MVTSERPLRRGRGVLGASASLGALKLVSGVGFVVATPPLLQQLGPARFGLWALGASLLAYASVFDLGLGSAVTVQMGRAHQRGRHDEELGVALLAAAAYVALTVVPLGLLTLTMGAVTGLLGVDPPLRSATAGFFTALLVAWGIQRVTAVFATLLDVRRRFAVSQGLPIVARGLSWPAAAVAVHAGVDLAGLGWVVAVISVGVAAVTLAVVARAVPRVRPTFAIRDLRGAIRLSGSVQLASIADLVNFATDRVIIAALLGVAVVAPYELASRGASMLRIVAVAPLALLLPVLATYPERQLREGGTLRQVSRWYATVVGLLTAGAVVLAEPAVGWWVGHDPEVVVLMRVLCVAYGVHAVTGVYTVAAKALHRYGPALWFAVWAAGVNVAATVVLAPRSGLAGVVVGTAIGLTIPSLVYLAVGCRDLGLGSWPLWCLGRVAVAAAAAVVAGSSASFLSDQPLPSVLLAGAVTLGVYGAGAGVLGLVRITDLSRLRGDGSTPVAARPPPVGASAAGERAAGVVVGALPGGRAVGGDER